MGVVSCVAVAVYLLTFFIRIFLLVCIIIINFSLFFSSFNRPKSCFNNILTKFHYFTGIQEKAHRQ